MSPDWVARGIAIGSGTVAVASLGWNITAWRRQGPVMKINATCVERGDQMKINGRIFNSGRFDTRVEKVTFKWMTQGKSPTGAAFVSCTLSKDYIDGIDLPLSLPSQSGFDFTIADFHSIDLGLEVALHDRRQAFLYFHAASGKYVRCSIKYK